MERDARFALLSSPIEKAQYSASSAAGNFILTGIFMFLIIVAGSLLLFYRNQKKSGTPISHKPTTSFEPKSLNVPKGLFFDKSHTWVYMEKDGNVRIGMDEFLCHVTGPVTRVMMKSRGEKVNKGEVILSLIQNGKHLDIYAPVSGIIREKNDALSSNATMLNQSPYNEGWVYMIEPSNWLRETRFMVMADRYSEWLNFEFTRLKDFFSIALRTRENDLMLVLQDGGEIKDEILADFGPEVWEDFQTRFIDYSK